jgi:rhomboid protease GluP
MMYRFEIRASITNIIILSNLLVYLLTSIAGNNYLETSLDVLKKVGQYNFQVYQGDVWQLITSIFVHVTPLHLMGNMLFLMIFGIGAEVLFTNRQYLTIYFASGIFGSILSLFMGIDSVSAGASGAIFGLFGAVTIYSERLNVETILIALVYSMYFLMLNMGVNVNVYSHAGGLFIGLILGYKYSQRQS